MIHRRENEQAVSPVIGTILLVAITVVLIAIIAAVVMGLVNQPEPKKVGLMVEPYVAEGIPGHDGSFSGINPNGVVNGVSLMVYGGEDVDRLQSLTVHIADYMIRNGSASHVSNSNEVGVDYVITDIEIGKLYKARIPHNLEPAEHNYFQDIPVTVVGTFDDGSEWILYKSVMTIPYRKAI